MKEPTNLGIKTWLVDNCIVGLKVHYYPTGVDTSDTDWTLIPSTGKPKRLKARTVEGLVVVHPDWHTVLRPTKEVIEEVRAWENTINAEADGLREYKRLKKKFS